MLVLIDESGDPGFKIVRGSTSHFVIAMVIFHDFQAAERAAVCIKRTQSRLRVKPEFKFTKSCDSVRDAFFEAVSDCKFEVRAIVVDKSKIYSENLRAETAKFHNYFVKSLLHNDNDALSEAKVKIDGCGSRVFKRELNSYLRRELPRDKVRSVGMYDSKSDVLLQLADMCAGAVLRARTGKRLNDRRWLDALQQAGQVANIWDFR